MEFEKIPEEFLSEIFKKAKGVKSEKIIFQYVLEALKKEREETSRKKLIESIEIKGLKKEEFQELIKNMKYEDFSEEIFLKLKEKIISNEEEKEEIKTKLHNKKKALHNQNIDLQKKIEELEKNKEEDSKHDDIIEWIDKSDILYTKPVLNQPFGGIITKLREYYNDNPHNKGIITITSSGKWKPTS